MLVVVASYRQNVRAYPSGGGDYEVATVNLGPKAGLTVASSLLVDYVLTVAVSVSSGVQNAGAALTFIRGHEMPVAVGLVVLLTAMNLRGVRESGKAFAVPVYAFMLGIIGMAAFGFMRAATGTLPQADERAVRPRAGAGRQQPRPASRCSSCCCGRSPRAVPPSPASRRSATASPRSRSPRAATPPPRCCSWASSP